MRLKATEVFGYLLSCFAGLFLFALPIEVVLLILGSVFVVFPFYAVYAATKAKNGGEYDEGNPHQRALRMLQKCMLVFLPSLGIGALIFES